jgi:hypothetical protein
LMSRARLANRFLLLFLRTVFKNKKQKIVFYCFFVKKAFGSVSENNF